MFHSLNYPKRYFVWHISWTFRVFPWSNRADIHRFFCQNDVFLVLGRFQVDRMSSSENRQIFKFSSKFWHFLWHISWPERVFPWSNRAHIKQAPSSNIVLKRLLRISWSVKYFCQKYWVKGSKSCNSAGTPRISRRPVQRQRWGRVLRTILFKNHCFLR